jgi:hypothetical protein
MLFIDHVLRSMTQSIFGDALLAYLVLPLKSDPMVMKTLEGDQRSRMVEGPQLASDLTHHLKYTILSCVLLVSQPQSSIFEAIRSNGPD